MSRMTRIDCLWLVAAVALTRFAFRIESPYLLDSVNFILGVIEFDLERQQPHPPGYYLYIQAARLLQFVWSDPHTALVALSILASCGTVMLVYFLAREWFGRDAALFAGLIFASSPLCWFHGGVALVYIVEMFFSLLAGLLCWRNDRGRGSAAFSSAIVLGIAAGVRQSSIAFLGPLWLYSLRGAKPARVAGAFGLLIATLLAWMLPMAAASGGAAQYWNALAELWNRVPGRELALTGSPGVAALRIAAQVLGIGAIYVMIFASAAPLPLMRALPAGFDSPKRRFAAVWIAPALLFFSFGFLRLINGGYLLVIMPPLLAAVGAQAAEWFGEAKATPNHRLFAVAVFIALNLAAFLFAPGYFSYRNVRAVARETQEFQRALRELESPDVAMIIAFDDHLRGARHAGYYLPEFLTLQLPETVTINGARITAMRDRNTRILQSVPGPPFQRFIFYPPQPNFADIPGSTDALESFPPGALKTTKAGEFEVITGSVDDLFHLFRQSAARPE